MDENSIKDSFSSEEKREARPEAKKVKSSTPKEDRFFSDAEKQVNKIMKELTTLSELSIKHKGAYSEEHIEQIFRALRKKIENARKSFKVQDEDEDDFKFD